LAGRGCTSELLDRAKAICLNLIAEDCKDRGRDAISGEDDPMRGGA
jgi:hypothetical protein